MTVRGRARSGVTSRRCDVDTSLCCIKEANFDRIIIWIAATRDRVVQRMNSIGKISGIDNNLFDCSDQRRTRAGVNAHIVSDDTRMR